MGTLTTLANSVTTGWKKVLLEATPPDADYDHELMSVGELLPCHPAPENIFRCFTYFEPEDTRVVILGQDPYHGDGEAIGLCFGTEQDARIPPSLRNIEKEFEFHTHQFPPCGRRAAQSQRGCSPPEGQEFAYYSVKKCLIDTI